MSTATAGYGVFALVEPGHLGRAMKASGKQSDAYDLLARTYGGRDLAVSFFGMFGRSPRTVRTAMKIRIALDLADAAVLSARTDDADVRRKVLAVTLGWAGLNTLALVLDGRGSED